MKKKQIAFIEMETHSPLLEQCYLLLKEMEQVDFHFFVHQKVFEKLSAIPLEFITIIKNIEEIANKISCYDAFIVNTFHRNFEDYKLIFATKPSLTIIHNLNFSLFCKSIHWKNLWIEKEKFVYYLKLYLTEKINNKRKTIFETTRFGVLSQSLLETITFKKPILANKSEVVSLNYCKNSSFRHSDVINIVMPGNVSRKRKDIDLIFDVILALKAKSKLQFIFLGKPESNEIVNRIEFIKQKCHQNIDIKYYAKFIPWKEYSEVIKQSHLLLCPIKSKTSFYWVDEVYGKTKVSGAETDCIYNGKIGLFPTTYPKMDWHNLYYEDKKDLITFFDELTLSNLEKEYTILKPYLEKHTFANVKNQLEQQLIDLTQA